MAIINRDKDPSEQRTDLHVALGAVATGATKSVFVAPYPCTLQSVRVAAQGVSNAMQLGFYIQRFIAGSGETAFAIGISNVVLVNVGTSGVQGFSGLAATGSTLLNLGAGDVLRVATTVSNGNATDLALNIVLKKLEDIVSMNGATS